MKEPPKQKGQITVFCVLAMVLGSQNQSSSRSEVSMFVPQHSRPFTCSTQVPLTMDLLDTPPLKAALVDWLKPGCVFYTWLVATQLASTLKKHPFILCLSPPCLTTHLDKFMPQLHDLLVSWQVMNPQTHRGSGPLKSANPLPHRDNLGSRIQKNTSRCTLTSFQYVWNDTLRSDKFSETTFPAIEFACHQSIQTSCNYAQHSAVVYNSEPSFSAIGLTKFKNMLQYRCILHSS